jgi:hypothetical protein
MQGKPIVYFLLIDIVVIFDSGSTFLDFLSFLAPLGPQLLQLILFIVFQYFESMLELFEELVVVRAAWKLPKYLIGELVSGGGSVFIRNMIGKLLLGVIKELLIQNMLDGSIVQLLMNFSEVRYKLRFCRKGRAHLSWACL